MFQSFCTSDTAPHRASSVCGSFFYVNDICSTGSRGRSSTARVPGLAAGSLSLSQALAAGPRHGHWHWHFWPLEGALSPLSRY